MAPFGGPPLSPGGGVWGDFLRFRCLLVACLSLVLSVSSLLHAYRIMPTSHMLDRMKDTLHAYLCWRLAHVFNAATSVRPVAHRRSRMKTTAKKELNNQIHDFDPHLQPQNSLLRIFRLQPGLEWKLLLRRTWSGQKLLPMQFPELSLS